MTFHHGSSAMALVLHKGALPRDGLSRVVCSNTPYSMHHEPLVDTYAEFMCSATQPALFCTHPYSVHPQPSSLAMVHCSFRVLHGESKQKKCDHRHGDRDGRRQRTNHFPCQPVLWIPPSPVYRLFSFLSSQAESPPPWPQESAGVTLAADLWGLGLGQPNDQRFSFWQRGNRTGAACGLQGKGRGPGGEFGSGIVVLSLSPSTRALPF